jgi:hypothetical protein
MFTRNTLYSWLRRDDEKGVVGGRWGRALRELAAFWAGKFLLVGNNGKHDTMGEMWHNRVIGLRTYSSPPIHGETIMTIDTINIFKSIASAHNSGLSALDAIKTYIAVLREAKIVMGKSVKTCAYRVQCVDAYAIAFPKVAKKTRDNYVTAIVDAVNNGTEFSFSASKGKQNKAKGKTEKDATIFPILAKLFCHEDFGKLTADLESMFENDEGHMKDLIQSMLESEGYEIES